MARILIALIILILVMTIPVQGYCYSNTVAQRGIGRIFISDDRTNSTSTFDEKKFINFSIGECYGLSSLVGGGVTIYNGRMAFSFAEGLRAQAEINKATYKNHPEGSELYKVYYNAHQTDLRRIDQNMYNGYFSIGAGCVLIILAIIIIAGTAYLYYK